MLTHGTPWQGVLGAAFERFIIFVLLLITSMAAGYFNWYPIIPGVFLLCSFVLLVQLIPLLLNLSRSYWLFIVALLSFHVLSTISSFALYFWNAGIVDKDGRIVRTVRDAFYFSVTTFTTLGYGDFSPTPSTRLATSMEALAGMASMAIGASLVWLWCQENLVDAEMAFFDGYRRHKQSLAVSRIRVRTITGKPRILRNWAPAPDGEVYFWSNKVQEWIIVDKEHQPSANDLVIRVSKDEVPNKASEVTSGSAPGASPEAPQG